MGTTPYLNEALWVKRSLPCYAKCIFHIPTSTFLVLCDELMKVEVGTVAKLHTMVEQVASFLYVVGHNSSDGQAQDHFQHSGHTTSNSLSKFNQDLSSVHLSITPLVTYSQIHSSVPLSTSG
ncbi:uncharacterized protein VP01_2282g2 [Puccinia sorghi]|uniref:DUF8040 domain-containing protein n=1 Tax=Puccinia sorghi TaxID=27349 RepID=A0A0L6V8U4_9BASI|nr:uncharacterized protein VP01_2282g2 [Puccinia sorghi]